MKHRSLAAAFLSLAIISSGILPFQASAQRPSEWNGGSQQDISDWRQANDSIRKAIDNLPEDADATIPMPVLFGVAPSNLSPNFGDPRSGGRTHEGEDIMAPKGAPIVSPTEAVVIGMGVWTGAGNYVSTANPGGETFVYMHLDSFANIDEGDVLDEGDVIGYVGNTGNASGGAPHLHFEIRKDRGATDPFPRLKDEFTLSQKIGFTENVINDSDDEQEMAAFLVANYRSQFLAAQALNIDLPNEIEKEMKGTPASGTAAVASFPGDLTLGSSGNEVITLQKFLITQNVGPAAKALANAGATGNFGPITRTALIEYQKARGITPADGYYGPLTRAYVQQAKPVVVAPAVVTPNTATTPTAPTTNTSTVKLPAPAQDMELGAKGAGVIWLQTFLISMRSGPAATALSEAGATGYFGSVTKAALAEYQKKNGISPAAGYFGPTTRVRITAALKAQ